MKCFKIRRSFKIGYRHVGFSDQTNFRWLRRFVNDVEREMTCKDKPAQTIPIAANNRLSMNGIHFFQQDFK